MKLMRLLSPHDKAPESQGGIHCENGVPSAVILPLAEYEELLEDLHDLAVIARRKDEPLIPLAEVKRRLKSQA